MRAKRRVAHLLGLVGRPLWAEIEVTLQHRVDEHARAVRDRREMQAYIETVQMLSYEQGVADLLHDVEIAIGARSADLDLPVLDHLRRLANHWRTTGR